MWDGDRPQRAVDSFLSSAAQPEDRQTKPRHYPNITRNEMVSQGYVAELSGHTRGSAVDLTLYHLTTGDLAAMGGRHDLMDPISSHHTSGTTPLEAETREHLRSVMEDCGFDSYDREWWHYTLRDEPHPDAYFDFPIT